MFQTWLWRRWRGVFDIMVANSESVKRLMAAEGFAPLELIRCGIPAQERRPPLSQPPTVAFVGRFVRQKGVEVLVRAFARVVSQIPDARLLLVGDGPEHSSLQSLIDRLRLSESVTFTGQVPNEAVGPACCGAWVQAIPSLYAEAYPLVAGEAMLRGTAVVASDCGGMAETVQHGRTGLLVPPGSDLALADALVQLLRNPEQAERFGRAGHAVAMEQWNAEAFIDRFVHIYETLCRDSSKSRS